MTTPRRSARLRSTSATPACEDTSAAAIVNAKPTDNAPLTNGSSAETGSGVEFETPKKKTAENRKRSRKNTPKPKLDSVEEEQQQQQKQQEENEQVSKQLTTELKDSSPVAPATMSPTKRTPLQTPRTEKKYYPGLEEMHPSKAHQSTKKQPDSGLRLGFTDIADKASGKNKFLQETPTKSRTAACPASPGFEFKFTHPGPSLSAEAQKLRESIQEEAAKLKVEMAEQKEKEKEKAQEAESSAAAAAGRKIAKPKGRFSDAHHSAFEKMDSIAGHASSFRSQTNRQQSASSSNSSARVSRSPAPASNTTLKRTKSQAKLDEQPEAKRPEAKRPTAGSQSDKEEETGKAAPTKRKKGNAGDDVSAARPRSREATPHIDTDVSTPKVDRSKAHISASFATPTKASLARSAASVKMPKTSLIPKLGRPVGSPRVARTDTTNRFRSAFSVVGAMRSILRRPQPRFSDDPLKQASGTHVATPKGMKDINHEQTPATPETPQLNSPSVRHVKFTPDLVAKGGNDSPAPATPQQRISNETGSSSKKKNKASKNTPTPNKSPSTPTIAYPALPSLDTVSQSPSPVKVQPKRPGISDFTFRTEQTIKFPTPKGATIRHVRPSIVPSPATTTATDAATAAAAVAGTDDPLTRLQNLPAVPHGMPNKKRRRSVMESKNDVEGSDVENQNDEGASTSPRKKGNKRNKSNSPTAAAVPPPPVTPRAAKRTKFVHDHRQQQPEGGQDGHGEEIKSAAKRAKMGLKGDFSSSRSATGTTPRSSIAKRVMSLSRLNELAKPKNRK
ncbi:hypothetical protein L228DRAFT_147319 [Xylona heveae TC161]|uniref:Erythromycin esterase n=1 Tax=Xylona heveae (strain CBS 132557 / TC161) TaxID=1328760 RepID=A0A165GGC8_XYLHT|nr:hypothetical protein L228DRAFT_147319 [Xylona heveae TC161]KZF22151.1 hypothetical protein L228DRAFT_147319 [Xylona heveae TC161]